MARMEDRLTLLAFHYHPRVALTLVTKKDQQHLQYRKGKGLIGNERYLFMTSSSSSSSYKFRRLYKTRQITWLKQMTTSWRTGILKDK